MKQSELSAYLHSLREEHGAVTPDIVKEAARPTSSPIHLMVFDKPVGDAAEAYYTDRARDLIQSVRVTVEQDDGRKLSVREWLATPAEHTKFTYEPLAVVMSDAEKRGMVLLEANRRAREAQTAFEQLEALLAGAPEEKTARRAKAFVADARAVLDEIS